MKLSRLRAMSADDQVSWDLSRKDVEAIRYALARISGLELAVLDANAKVSQLESELDASVAAANAAIADVNALNVCLSLVSEAVGECVRGRHAVESRTQNGASVVTRVVDISLPYSWFQSAVEILCPPSHH